MSAAGTTRRPVFRPGRRLCPPSTVLPGRSGPDRHSAGHAPTGAVLVDVGCGTGISSRLFTERGMSVIGIEPNAAMRGEPKRRARPGRRRAAPWMPAEATGLPDAAAECVVAA